MNYRKMYAVLCVAASKALDELPKNPETLNGRKTLQDALEKAEEMYIQEGKDTHKCSILLYILYLECTC